MKNFSPVVVLCGMYLIWSYAFDAFVLIGVSGKTLATPNYIFQLQYAAQVFIPIIAGFLALAHKRIALWVLCAYIVMRAITAAYWAPDLLLFLFMIDWSYVVTALLLWWKRTSLSSVRPIPVDSEVTSNA